MQNDSQETGEKIIDESIDLKGKLCPFAVMCIIKDVDVMKRGETRVFVVDDPLAIKSVPEELTEYEATTVSVRKLDKSWEISVTLNETE
jgi:TusA-related sulfurtransferase